MGSTLHDVDLLDFAPFARINVDPSFVSRLPSTVLYEQASVAL